MTLNKKHYIRFAEILKAVKTEHNHKCFSCKIALVDLEERLTQFFKEDYAKFDNWRFAEASKVETVKTIGRTVADIQKQERI